MPIDKKRILKQLNLSEVPVKEIVSELSNCTFYELSLFYVNDRTPREVLDGRTFDSLWEGHREKLSLWDIPEFKLQKQDGFSDRELVIGLGLYYSAVSFKAQKQEKAFLKYLNLAMNYGSCQAFQTAVNNLEIEAHQVSRSEVQNTSVKLSEILNKWSSMLMKHRTPGLLLLANTNLFLARELKGACNSDMLIAAYQLTWQYLRMAELCEEDSQAAINNVYFGKGLALSNPFNLADVSTMKNELGVEVKALLTPSQVTYAENEALNLYNKQLKIVRLKAPPFSLGGAVTMPKRLENHSRIRFQAQEDPESILAGKFSLQCSFNKEKMPMFKPLALYIGLRYTRAKKKNHFVSFISLSSMLGIGLGVMVLITVLSVMNGFDVEIHRRFFGMAPEITVTGRDGKISDWPALEKKLSKIPGIKAIVPFVGGQGLLTNEGQVLPIILTGVDPELEEKVSHIKEKMLIGNLSNLKNFGIILGRGLADNLGVMIGDKVTIMIPQATVTPAGMIPRFKRFTVEGVFSAGNGFNFDTKLAFINLNDAQKLMQLGNDVTGLKLKINNIYNAPKLSETIAAKLGEEYQVGNWTDQFGAFFDAVKMEKTMMFLILLLIIGVAAFNLVSSLVMVVNDKQSEIAILRTIGATPGVILWTFIVQGMLVGVIGTLIGLVGGIILASNATAIVNWLQAFFDTRVLSSSIYFVDYLPSKIMISDLIKICAAALTMSFLATIYPAWRASKTVIAEALHYE